MTTPSRLRYGVVTRLVSRCWSTPSRVPSVRFGQLPSPKKDIDEDKPSPLGDGRTRCPDITISVHLWGNMIRRNNRQPGDRIQLLLLYA